MNGETRGGFCGHRNEYEIPVGATERTRMQIIRLYQTGGREFWSGGMGWFGQSVRDEACEQTVRKPYSSGEIGQDTQLWLIRPYPPEESGEKAQSLNEAYTGVLCPNFKKFYYKGAIVKRNRWMVDHCDYMIACVAYIAGGSAQTLAYAQSRKTIQIICVEA